MFILNGLRGSTHLKTKWV